MVAEVIFQELLPNQLVEAHGDSVDRSHIVNTHDEPPAHYLSADWISDFEPIGIVV